MYGRLEKLYPHPLLQGGEGWYIVWGVRCGWKECAAFEAHEFGVLRRMDINELRIPRNVDYWARQNAQMFLGSRMRRPREWKYAFWLGARQKSSVREPVRLRQNVYFITEHKAVTVGFLTIFFQKPSNFLRSRPILLRWRAQKPAVR